MTEQPTRRLANNASRRDEEVTIEQPTVSYENWMRSCTTVVVSDLRSKHQQMKKSPFLFLRGTFYRWAQQWPSICTDLCSAPQVLAVGDGDRCSPTHFSNPAGCGNASWSLRFVRGFRIQAWGTSRCRGPRESNPAIARADQDRGRRVDLVQGRPSRRSSLHCRSAGRLRRDD